MLCFVGYSLNQMEELNFHISFNSLPLTKEETERTEVLLLETLDYFQRFLRVGLCYCCVTVEAAAVRMIRLSIAR